MTTTTPYSGTDYSGTDYSSTDYSSTIHSNKARPGVGRVTILDTTLRDGEQSPGISLAAEEKVEIARQLARLGVDVIEAGFPVASDGDRAAVAAIAAGVEGPTICALSRTHRADIDTTAHCLEAAGTSRVHLFLATSAIHLEHKLRMTTTQALDEIVAAITHARGRFDEIQFSPEDASRTDEGFLVEVLSAASEAGATILNIPDTVGYAVPSAWAERIAKLIAAVGNDQVVFSVHCHDDLGLAVANTLAGVEGGARQVEVAVNGIGERAGNAALEEVAMALTVRADHFGDLAVGIDTRELLATSRLVERLTGYRVPANKAVVGANAFAHESGIHQHGVLAAPATYEIIDPQAVGSSSALVLGKHSGRAALVARAAELGFRLQGIALDDAQRSLKALADRKGRIDDEDLVALCTGALGHDQRRSWSLESLSFTDGGGVLEASVTLERAALAVAGQSDENDGDENDDENDDQNGDKDEDEAQGRVMRSATAQGDGFVDAALAAVTAATASAAQVLTYRVEARGSGSAALGEVTVTVAIDGRRVTGRAVGPDIVRASAEALCDAIGRDEHGLGRRS